MGYLEVPSSSQSKNIFNGYNPVTYMYMSDQIINKAINIKKEAIILK